MVTSPVDRIGNDAATPPRRPTPMPRQEIAFWTPRRVLAASRRMAVAALRQATRHGTAGGAAR